VLGLCHSLAESFVLWWYGLALVPLDIALLGVAGIALATVASSILLPVTLGLVQITRWSLLRCHVALCLLAYGGIGLQLSLDSVGTSAWTAAALVLAALALAIARLVARSPAGLVGGVLFYCLLAQAGTLFAAESSSIPAARHPAFALNVILPGLLVAALSGFLGRHPSARASVTGWALLGLNLLLGVLWLGVGPRQSRWHVLEGERSETAVLPVRNDVFLIVLDTVRADHLDLFGYSRPTMPLLKELAQECAVAQPMMATSPSSLPSHGSMFTGLYSSRHGGHKPFLNDEDPPPYAYYLRSDLPTLAELLAAQGYHSVGISANFGVLSSYGLGRGFTHYDVAPGPSYRSAQICWLKKLRLFGRTPSGAIRRLLPQAVERRTRVFNRFQPPYRRAEEINQGILSWLEEHPEERMFAFLNYFDAHDPYLPPPEFDQRFGSSPNKDWIGFPDRAYGRLLRGNNTLSAAEVEFMKAQYDAELCYLDQQLHDFLQRLRQLGRFDDSLIFIVGDHGEAFLEHGFLRHSTSLYQPQVSVPLLVKLPLGSPAPPASAAQLQFVDLLPTTLHLLGIQAPDDLDGSIWAEGRDYSLSEVYCHQPQIARLRRELAAVQRGPRKLIQSSDGSLENFDLSKDPREQQSDSAASVWIESAQVILDQREVHRPSGSAGTQDSPLLDRLRELGYVDAE
jgi:arylsulfatase A-like enzyme